MSTTQNTTSLKAALNLRYEIDAYTTIAAAKFSIQHRVKKCWVVVMGDNLKYWVVCMADASKLIAAGYEMLPVGA